MALFTPPTWRMVTRMEGALRYGFPVCTVVYRQGGVWHNLQTAGVGNPVVADVDTDAASGLLLFFSTPTPVPSALEAEITANALTPADPSWTAGTLT